jgi:hypothetical protein
VEILYRQKGIGWCSVYLLANIFRDHSFLRYTDDERFKGCGDNEVNEMIDFAGIKITNVLYAQQHYPPLPTDYMFSVLMNDEADPDGIEIPITPFLLTVRLIPSIWHHVGVLRYKNQLYYLDPYKSHLIEIKTADDLASQFIDCCQVQRPYRIEDDKFCVIKGEDLGYDFLINKH